MSAVRPAIRYRALAAPVACVGLVVAIAICGAAIGAAASTVDFATRLARPSLAHPFGTDVMGRDVLMRTAKGLGLSLWIGLLAAILSSAIAVSLTLVSAANRWVGATVSFITDAALCLPHLVLLVLIAFSLGGGAAAVVAAVALSHWPRLTRLLRGELQQVLTSDFVAASRAFGRSRTHVALGHVVPFLAPQIAIGAILMMPHAILHEAALTFLGFGLEPTRPAIGIMLADAMRHLGAGRWWLGLFPGLGLVVMVLAFERTGAALRSLVEPRDRDTGP